MSSEMIEYTLEQRIAICRQHYTLLQESLDELHEKQQVETDAKKKQQIQQQIIHIRQEQKETRQQLKQLKQEPIVTDGVYSAPSVRHTIPMLPKHPLVPTALFDTIKSHLVATTSVAEASNGQRTPILLHGTPGVGKSVLATQLAVDSEISKHFRNGIFWMNLGQEPDILTHQNTLIYSLDTASPDFIDAEAATTHLRKLCQDRFCLFILDDVWDVRDILPFSALGKECQLFVTTCEAQLVDLIKHFMPNVQSYALAPLAEKQGIEIFCQWSNIPSGNAAEIPAPVRAMVRACEQLPLALKLMSNIAGTESTVNWEKWLKTFQSIACLMADRYPRPLMRALQIATDLLGEDVAEQYFALGVFAEYTHIPLSTIKMLWRYLYHFNEERSATLIYELANRGLLELKGTSPHLIVNLHTSQHDFVCENTDLEKLHGHLLAAYRRQSGQHGWISVPKDGYFFEHLCAHLIHANRQKELKNLLLDFDWLQAKLQFSSLHSLLSDYELLEDQELTLIKTALRHSASILLKDSEQLATQLLNNLWSKPSPGIQKLLNQAKEIAPDWRPR